MKTAAEWITEADQYDGPHEFIAAIQLDAYKAGLTKAAEVVEKRRAYNELIAATYLSGESLDCRNAIRDFRDNLKELP